MARYMGAGLPRRLVPNGASTSFYGIGTPASRTRPVVMFVGPTSYDVNVEGVSWFLDRVWPRVRADVPDARFEIVGSGWGSLSRDTPGVMVRGFVPDLATDVSGARVVVAPVRAGGGTKIKVLEAMAAARPVVATSIGAEGIPASPGVAVADDERGFAAGVVRWLSGAEEAASAGAANRRAVGELTWSRIWSRALQHLEEL